MSAQAILEYEGRVRQRYAIIAAAAGVLVMAAAVMGLVGPHPKVAELTTELIVAHRRFPLDVISAVINSAGLIGFALVVSFLAVSTRGRRSETNPASRVVALVGGALAAGSGIAYAIVIAIKVDQFVSHGSQTYEEAHHLTSSFGIAVLPFLGQFSALLLAMGVFFVALNAMRTGLLTRFMGYLGIFTGVLVIFPIGSPIPIVQGFWLLALSVLFADRWPNGTPPAWSTGRAEPWPPSTTAAQRGTPATREAKAGRDAPKTGPAPPASKRVPVGPSSGGQRRKKRKKR